MASKPLSAEDAAALAQHFKGQKRPSKYRNVKTVVDGITFDSRKEAKRYGELMLLQKAGHIRSLQCQVRYALSTHGGRIGNYVADFVYERFLYPGESKECETVVEDVKGVRTPLYRWKKKHVEAQYGIRITET